MTPTEKQKCIAEQAVYGDLHFVNPSENVRKLDVVSSIVAYSDKGGIFTPILRPLADLAKEITHKGYNDDEPFIPADVLGYEKWDGELGVIEYAEYAEGPRVVINPLDYKSRLDLLHLWHFDTRSLIESGEAIDANTLNINPYEV